jgi:hypothetical protein
MRASSKDLPRGKHLQGTFSRGFNAAGGVQMPARSLSCTHPFYKFFGVVTMDSRPNPTRTTPRIAIKLRQPRKM